ncbi:Helicase conserved C-terminal domain-containing protein [Bosea sp. CRIB-10]|uniref:DEAD/DEAH box helicase family protein n=1 Tax=Bosea sp. CRIB-10 TaxID=378404 RepID=UPI0008E11EFD|nr:DEAD/DEAH box helicase family protein [Bosea sp. CRIB-10]SFD47317.1 Helicase conserved C-terminal domain-containing protein [Bosea sp. CRIB-10]
MSNGYSATQLRGIGEEVKEAVCDGLVNLIVDRVSGADEHGRVIFGRSPRRAIFSGQLLPRFDDNGQEDETSDIRIAAIGLDFTTRSGIGGDLTIQPSAAVYIRALPTWDELQNPRNGLEIDFRLNTATQTAIDLAIRTRRQQLFLEQGLDRPRWRDLTETARSEVRRRRSDIQEQVRIEAYRAQSIELVRGDMDDSAVEESPPEPGPAGPDPAQPLEAEPRPRIATLLRQGRRIPYGLIDPAQLPGKWVRLPLTLPAGNLRLEADADAIAVAIAAYRDQLRLAAAASVADWLASEEGRLTAWRNVVIRPADAQDEAAYNTFLTAAQAIPVNAADVVPDLSRLTVTVERQQDFVDPTVQSYRLTFDNQAPDVPLRQALMRCHALFGCALRVELPSAAHLPLRLDRVEPSYRFRHFLEYPAIGLNCGVDAEVGRETVSLKTTWAPRFVQPRIIPRSADVPTQFGRLADRTLRVGDLHALPAAYTAWVRDHVSSLRDQVRDGLSPEDAGIETARLAVDEAGQSDEAGFIRRGVDLLIEAQAASEQLAAAPEGPNAAGLRRRAAPYEAWLLMNRSFFERDGADGGRGWRLFQLAFVLAHIPTLASRMPEYRTYYNARLDEDTVSLLYFPTGGGKSEAFYGTLLFGLFLDRLRGKDRGVSVLIRYPLRLLTLQQAQRLLRLLINAELIRRREGIGSWPFEIGFWVGASNTPNRYAAVSADVPLAGDADFADDARLEDGADESPAIRDRGRRYRELRTAYDKVPTCPGCGSQTGLRRYEVEGPTAKRLAILCFDRRCRWNQAHGQLTPLPFLLTDDTIYARAPSVLLGTVDKLAMLGQDTNTVAKVVGMFGLARWVGPTGHLDTPRRTDNLRDGPGATGYAPVFPAYRNGQRVFHDPFPALIIQDEAHLLEESLGTFSGLFDTLLEHVFQEIDAAAGDDLQLARAWRGDDWGAARMPKVIAATATISDPDRQIEVLYQRRALRFPYPGPDIYHSFFAEPAPAPGGNPDRQQLAEALPSWEAPEATSPWMRLYVSLMTNDATHTVTSVHVLGVFHTLISELWADLVVEETRARAVARLRAAISPGRAGDWRRAAIDRCVADGRDEDVLAVVDLHRIALAYVTNKKGGDQIMDALDAAVRLGHQAAGVPIEHFDSRLISGGVDMKDIQTVMGDAERSFAGQRYPPLDSLVRNIVATSAISHGVDVDRFNSMFFAGLPSDVAEYIQASSRVGRTHIGFVMLLPTPQSRRDRYVVETHDIFHRFLERMIAPPAVERWAENAIRRVFASYIQAWAITKEGVEFIRTADAIKERAPQFDYVGRLGGDARREPIRFPDEIGNFILRAVGFEGRGRDHVGRPVYDEPYRRLVDRASQEFSNSMKAQSTESRLRDYWADQTAVFKKPMTSLRDVDEAGMIVGSAYDPASRTNNTRVEPAALARVMRAIRSQRGAVAETDAELDGENA